MECFGHLTLGCDNLPIGKIRVYSMIKVLLFIISPQRRAEYVIARWPVR